MNLLTVGAVVGVCVASIACVAANLRVALHNMRAAELFNRATDAYQRGDVTAGDMYHARALVLGTRNPYPHWFGRRYADAPVK